MYVENKNIGNLFELHPSLQRRYGFPSRVGLVQIDLSTLFTLKTRTALYSPSSPYPTISYDETTRCPRDISAQSLLKRLEKAHEYLQHARLIRAFEHGEQISYTFCLTYGAPDRTLAEEEVQPIHREIVKRLAVSGPSPPESCRAGDRVIRAGKQ